jgi:hypothetical protein
MAALNTTEVIVICVSFAGALVGAMWVIAQVLSSRLDDITRRLDHIESRLERMEDSFTHVREDVAVLKATS